MTGCAEPRLGCHCMLPCLLSLMRLRLPLQGM
jgi:hypothetical protein